MFNIFNIFKKDKDIGLALGSGGVKGFVHIGVLRVLEEKGYNIKCIAGSSAGALVGGLYAYYKDVKKLEEIVAEQNFISIFKVVKDIKIGKGFLKGDKFKELLKEYIGETKIDDLDIKFSAVTTDMVNGKKVVLDKGFLVDAILASIAVPIVFNPVEDKDQLLVDGGVIEPVPYNTVKEMGCKKILGIDLNRNQGSEKRSPLLRTIEILSKELAEEQSKVAWKVIAPEFKGTISALKFDRESLIQKGEEEARKIIP